MKVYKELKEIALMNEKRQILCEKLEKKIDIDDFSLEYAKPVRNCTEKNGHLYNAEGKRLDNYGLVDDEYYCYQLQGYCEDDFYGELYYATNEKGVFVEIPFHC